MTYENETRQRVTLHLGDCIEVMRTLADSSVDSIVTDPPYHLTTGKKGGSGQKSVNLDSPYGRARIGTGFMGMKWDGGDIAFNLDLWTEALRVLKPGGHLLAFSGTRTQHRMVCAIEDAGFEIRDQIGWLYGSGFPKSRNISKDMDSMGGTSVAWFGAWLKRWREERGLSQKELCERCEFFGKINRGGTIANWELGLGQPSVEQFNRICRELDLPFDSMEAAEREVIGKKAVNPGVAFSSTGPSEIDVTAPATDAARQWAGWGTALKPAWEPVCVARKPLVGTVAANVLAFGTGAINVDGCRVNPGDPTKTGGRSARGNGGVYGDGVAPAPFESHTDGRWPANLIHDGSEEVLAAFPDAPGQLADASANGDARKTQNTYGAMKRGHHEASANSENEGLVGFKMKPGARRLDGGSAARFFYCAKASSSDRHSGLEHPGHQFKKGSTLRDAENLGAERKGNHHPTVKPTDLMAYLVRLVTPPGGLVLDPFMGSGSTGKACMREGFRFIGIDMSAEYVEIARARITAEHDRVAQAAAEAAKPDPQLDFFKQGSERLDAEAEA